MPDLEKIRSTSAQRDHDVAGAEATGSEAAVVMPLQITQSRLGATASIGLEGEFDLAGVPVLRGVAVEVLQRCPSGLVLDLSGLSFIDASGVRAAVELSERSIAENIKLEIIPGPRAVHSVFEFCQLIDTLPFITPA